MRASGVGGELRHGYQQAARLGPWTIKRDGATWLLSAGVVAEHAIWMARRPLNLVLALGGVEWIWREVEPAAEDGRIVVRLDRRPDVVGSVAAAQEVRE